MCILAPLVGYLSIISRPEKTYTNTSKVAKDIIDIKPDAAMLFDDSRRAGPVVQST